MKSGIKLGEEFRPSPKLKSLYRLYLVPILLFAFIWWILPLAAIVAGDTAFLLVVSGFGTLVIIIFAFAFFWISKYYGTITYSFTGHEMTWRRGVWFRNTGIVPYNRITNIDISQGPISRMFGIASLKIQTAGYSGASATKSSEIAICGIERFEELREDIMSLVRGMGPVAVESYAEEKTGLLNELVKIRKLLEKR